jgi:hypothetical protein
MVKGSFEGIRYSTRASGSAQIPKLVGCYESELPFWLAGIRKQPIETAIEDGAAEDYYADGLVRLCPNPNDRVLADEADALFQMLPSHTF